jgi:hypothetical protein
MLEGWKDVTALLTLYYYIVARSAGDDYFRGLRPYSINALKLKQLISSALNKTLALKTISVAL